MIQQLQHTPFIPHLNPIMETTDSDPPIAEEAVESTYAAELAQGEATKRNYLVCQTCRFPVASSADFLAEKIECWRPAVFSYKFSVWDAHIADDDAPEDTAEGVVYSYSATNPGQHRFDVIRIKPTPAIRTERPRGGPGHWSRPTPEHCWFPGTAWRMASCAVCDAHLGWGYSKWIDDGNVVPSGPGPDVEQGNEEEEEEQGVEAPVQQGEPTTSPVTAGSATPTTPTPPSAVSTTIADLNSAAPVEFIGLILTKVAPTQLSDAEHECLQKERQDFALNPAFATRYSTAFRNAVDTLNRLPAAIGAAFYAPLREMQLRPQLRTTVHDVSRMIGALLERVRSGTAGVVNVPVGDIEDGTEASSDDDEDEDEIVEEGSDEDVAEHEFVEDEDDAEEDMESADEEQREERHED